MEQLNTENEKRQLFSIQIEYKKQLDGDYLRNIFYELLSDMIKEWVKMRAAEYVYANIDSWVNALINEKKICISVWTTPEKLQTCIKKYSDDCSIIDKTTFLIDEAYNDIKKIWTTHRGDVCIEKTFSLSVPYIIIDKEKNTVLSQCRKKYGNETVSWLGSDVIALFVIQKLFENGVKICKEEDFKKSPKKRVNGKNLLIS